MPVLSKSQGMNDIALDVELASGADVTRWHQGCALAVAYRARIRPASGPFEGPGTTPRSPKPADSVASAKPPAEVAHRVREAQRGVVRIGYRSGLSVAHTQMQVDLANQQQPSVTDEVPSTAVGPS